MAKIKPILFNTEMVRAILEGRKTVTRRVVKLKYSNTHLQMFTNKYGTHLVEMQNEEPGVNTVKNPDGTTTHTVLACFEKEPPYRPGEILYVRETWRAWWARLYEADIHIEFKAGGEGSVLQFKNGYTDSPDRNDYNAFFEKWGVGTRWHPSIHMPKEAARIFLRVTKVYPQQLRDTTEEDAIAEGFRSRPELVAALLKTYPGSTEESWFWANEFQRISREEAVCELQGLRLHRPAWRKVVLRLPDDDRPLPPLPARGWLYGAAGERFARERECVYAAEGVGYGECA